jgi:hypothetical protein
MLDLDLSVPDLSRFSLPVTADEGANLLQAVYEYLQTAAGRDLNDGFLFLISQPKGEQTGAPGGGIRCSVEAWLAGRAFANFHVDVGLGDVVLGQPEWVDGNQFLNFAGVPAAYVALYPLEQQFAGKVHAYTFPWSDRDNTRVKDLVDLVLLVQSGVLQSEPVRQALRATFRTRGTHPLPKRLPEPPEDWAEPYVALAHELGLPALDLEGAYTYLETYWHNIRQSA